MLLMMRCFALSLVLMFWPAFVLAQETPTPTPTPTPDEPSPIPIPPAPQTPGPNGPGGSSSAVFELESLARLDVSEGLTPYGVDLMGERFDLATGAVSFDQMDVAIPGNSALPVEIRRSLRTAVKRFRRTDEFVDWSLDLPSMSLIVPQSQGWQSNRCTGPLHGLEQVTEFGLTYMQWQFSSGLKLNIPGQGARSVLDSPQSPVGATGVYGTTNDYWRITCFDLPGAVGEGFIATSPNGIKYTFGQLKYVRTSNIGIMQRDIATMLVTEVEDRYGNRVDYTYSSGKLTKIKSNDETNCSNCEREINITYLAGTSYIESAYVGPSSSTGRKWTYEYSFDTNGNAVRLKKVHLPEGLHWEFNLLAIAETEPNKGLRLGGCGLSRASSTGWIKHPYGAVGTYTLTETSHGMTDIIYVSGVGLGIDSLGDCIGEPVREQRSFDSMSITSKKLEGPGLSPLIWNYYYSEQNGAWTTSTGVDHQKYTRITEPSGVQTFYYFNRRKNWKDGALEKVEVMRDGAPSIVEQKTERSFVQGPSLGVPTITLENVDPTRFPRYVSELKVTRGSDTYTTNFTYNLNGSSGSYSFGSATTVEESNNLPSTYHPTTRTTVITYRHDKPNWQLRLPRKTTIDGEVVSEITYRTSTNLPQLIKRYGTIVERLWFYSNGTLNWSKDAFLNKTIFANYKRGVPRKITFPDTSIMRTSVVDDDGFVTGSTDPIGNTISYTYDDLKRLTKVDYPDESAGPNRDDNSITYSLVNGTDTGLSGGGLVNGQWKQVSSRGEYRETQYLDPLLRPVLTRIQDTSNSSIDRFARTSRRHDGSVSYSSFPSESASASNGIQYEFDALKRLTNIDLNVTPFSATSIAYLDDNEVEVTNPRGKVSTTRYFALGSPDASLPVKITQPESILTEIARSPLGEALSVTQSGGSPNVSATRSYIYDSKHRLCRRVDPETGSTAISHDVAGQIEWYAKAASGGVGSCNLSSVPTNQRILQSFDNMGRLRTVNYPDSSPDLTYDYDKNGNLTSLVSSAASRTYTHNKRNFVTSELLVTNGQSFLMVYDFDKQDRHVSTNYPSGLTLSITNNAYGEPEEVAGYASGIEYYPNGHVKKLTYGNGRVYSMVQDDRQLPKELKVVDSGSNVVKQTYGYDLNANISSIVDGVSSSSNRTVSYDDVGRIETSSGSWGVSNYSYDALGNIKTKNEGTNVMTMSYDSSNLVDTVTENSLIRSYSHDSAGNVIGNGYQTFTFDLAGNMIESNSPLVKMWYDGHNRRVRHKENGTNSYTLYGLGGQLLHKKDAGQKSDYIYAGKMLVAKKVAGKIHFLHTDVLGSPIAGKEGSNSYTEEFMPWGESLLNPIQLAEDVGFTGHQSDIATGLTYMEARYLDPSIGRFLSVDPVQFSSSSPQSFGRYTYAGNNPAIMIDPSGARECWFQKLCDWAESVLNQSMSNIDGIVDAKTEGGVDPFIDKRIADQVMIGTGAAMASASAEAAVEGAIFAATAIPTRGAVRIAPGRVWEIHGVLHPIAQSRRTTAIVETAEGVNVVASSNRYLSRAQRAMLRSDEVAASGLGHAEITALTTVSELGLTPYIVYISRAPCIECRKVLVKDLLRWVHAPPF